jgi:hypothetical protein
VNHTNEFSQWFQQCARLKNYAMLWLSWQEEELNVKVKGKSFLQ